MLEKTRELKRAMEREKTDRFERAKDIEKTKKV